MTRLNYVYAEQTRRPAIYLVAAASAAMMALAFWYGADWWFFPPILIGFSMALSMLVFNRWSGMELVGPDLLLYVGSWRRSLLVEQIVSVRVVRWMEGAPSISLDLKDGERVNIPGMCIGSVAELSDAFSNRSIPVTEI
jgi:hypothetical protein